jgi:hypothetical protein
MSPRVTLITCGSQGIGAGFAAGYSRPLPDGGGVCEWLRRAPVEMHARLLLQVLNDAAKSR